MVGITHPNQLQRDKYSALSKFSICTESEKAERSNKKQIIRNYLMFYVQDKKKLKYENTKHY